MNWLAAILTATLLAGCVSANRQYAAVEPPPISADGWQKAQTVLRDAPAGLRHVLTQAGEARLRHHGRAEPPNATAPPEAQSVILDILTHTRDQALLPDAGFEAMIDVVFGDNRQLNRSYAVALAGYLTRPDFGCQQPVYARYFQRRYAAEPSAAQCRADVPFSFFTRYDGAQTAWLDPKRVSSIHLLFASKSQSLASRFGHVALRLVVCPEGKTSAAECDANLFEHVVLGFMAHVDELSLNTIKALNGKYKAYLVANRFMDVYQEYAIGEFRELYSLPLRLDDAQREMMVKELADIHWSYAGEYRFLTQNCATMMQNALRMSWPAFAASDAMTSDYYRPDSLFEAIKAGPLAEGDKLATLDAAEREGYFFSSTRQFYDLALNEVRGEMKKPPFTSLESYLQIDPVKRRLAFAGDERFSARLAADKHLREAQIMLEEYAVLQSERMMMIEGAKYFEQQDFQSRADSIRVQLDAEHARIFDDCLLAPINRRVNPIQKMSGIPSSSEIPPASVPTSICHSVRDRKLLRETIEGIKDARSEQWRNLDGISQYWAESIANLNLLKKM